MTLGDLGLYNEIERCSKELAVVNYKLNLTSGEKLWDNLTLNPSTDLRDIISQVKMYALLEEDVKQDE